MCTAIAAGSRVVGSTRGSLIESLESRTLLSADLTAQFVRGAPGTFPPGQIGSAALRVTNVGDSAAIGQARIDLYASTIARISPAATQLTTSTVNLRLRPGASIVLRLTYPTPSNLPDAEYFTIADVEAQTFADANPSNNQVASRYVTEIVPPVIDLSVSAERAGRQVKLRGLPLSGKISAPVTVTNVGNAPARVGLEATLYLSTSSILDNNAVAIGALPARVISLMPHKRIALRVVGLLDSSLASDEYHLIAQVNGFGFADPNSGNNIALSPRLVKVVNPTIPPAPIIVGSLQSDTSVLFVGQPSFANLQLNVSSEVPAANVEVDEVDALGNMLTKLDNLFDDGAAAHNDITAHDGVFNNSISIGFDQAGVHYYAARAFAASGAMRESNIISIEVEPEPSPNVIQAAIGVASRLWMNMVNDISLIHGAPRLPILDAVASLSANPSAAIASSIVTTDHSIAWESPDGIESLLDCNQVIYQGKRGGGVDAVPSSAPALKASRGPAPPHNALLISAAGTQFEPDDEAQSAGALFTAAGWNITRGSALPSDFANLSSYGAIIVTAHGDSIPGIGPVIDTGATADDTASLLDLVNHRTILQNKSDLAITPQYIMRYAGKMPGTIVYVGGCSSTADPAMANAFLHQGASAFIGYSGSMSNTFAFTHGMDAVRSLVKSHKRVGSISKINKATDATAAVFQAIGNLKARLV